MKKQSKQILSLALSAVLLSAGVAAVCAAGVAREVEPAPAAEVADEQPEVFSAAKEETVYVIAGADGSVRKRIVSDWLQNGAGNAALSDRSTLTGIENVKGNEGFTQSGDALVWDAEGNDIYYQGTTEQALPVELRISYTLDGSPVTATELAGKSGHVTIRFDYINRLTQTVEIDGREESVCVPFAMLSGVLLDNDVCRNIEVTSGKIISDGDRSAVIGVAFPGLGESLALDPEKLALPTYVEISADAENFRFSGSMTVATNSVFNGLGDGLFDKADEAGSELGALTAGMQQLLDGSSALYDGVCTLFEKSGALIEGINRLSDGAARLQAGSDSLQNGSAELTAGAAALANGLQKLQSESAQLNGGAEAIFEALLHTADSQLATAGLTGLPTLSSENYKAVLQGVVSSLAPAVVREQASLAALAAVTQQVEANRETVAGKVTAAVREQVTAQVREAVRGECRVQVLAAMKLTEETYAAGAAAGAISQAQQQAVDNAVAQQMQSEAVQSVIEQHTDEQMESADCLSVIDAETEKAIAALVQENLQTAEVTARIEAAVAQAQAGSASVTALLTQLDSVKTFTEGVAAYTAGVAAAADGAAALRSGAGELDGGACALQAGVDALVEGMQTLQSGVPALTDGIGQLKEGAQQLADGLDAFNEQGIRPLTDALSGDLAGLLARARATMAASEAYTSFSGIADGATGSVKFIYRTDAIQ